MFRELARKNKQLEIDECIKLLREEKRGVFSVLGDDDYPYGMPMNHLYCEEDGCIYFHCGKQKGHRLDSLKKHDKASFCVYNEGCCEAGEWALAIESVIVFGRVEIIDDIDTITDISARLSRKFTQDEEYISKEIAAFAHETLLLRLKPGHICGKRVKEA